MRPVVRTLLIVNTVIFLLQRILVLLGQPEILGFLSLSAPGIQHGYLWQFGTYMFLHGGLFHLLFNMLALYCFGNAVESEIGSKSFLILYLLGGLFGGLVWYLFNLNTIVPMVGASGAIYATVIAFATLWPNRPITILVFFVVPITLLAKYWALITVVLSVLFLMDQTSNVAHLAHLSGMAVGFLFIKGLARGWSLRLPNLPDFFGRRGRTRLHVVPRSGMNEEFMQKRIDPILDKIAEQGIQSLTREERRLLDQAKDQLP